MLNITLHPDETRKERALQFTGLCPLTREQTEAAWQSKENGPHCFQEVRIQSEGSLPAYVTLSVQEQGRGNNELPYGDETPNFLGNGVGGWENSASL